ncbi:MAG TPA: selenium cofactor biosynthesis protein YqeC [Acidimicrobiia bacterium]|nr:selenium cofactor biosynthesis protein YqeC [Acidimicrobiia bacterium]
MTSPLHDRLGLGSHELVALVGAGGKSTILATLARELSDLRVIVTTTTRMAQDQVTQPTCWSDDPAVVDAALEPGSPLFVATERIPGKVIGVSPAAADRLFRMTLADHVLVEADGARGMAIKAPAAHEPVIPSASTTVIVVASIDAVGHPIAEVAHRHMLVGQIIGTHPDNLLTAEGAATVLLHPDGGLKGIPSEARVVMATTRVTPATRDDADALAALLASDPRVERVVTLS